MSAPLGKLLTVAAAAERLGMDEPTLRREIRARRLNVLRRGRAIGVYERWCDLYVETHTEAPTGRSRGVVDAFETAEPPAGIAMPAVPALRMN